MLLSLQELSAAGLEEPPTLHTPAPLGLRRGGGAFWTIDEVRHTHHSLKDRVVSCPGRCRTSAAL